MRILMIASAYPDDAAPLRGIFFRDQALALAANGHEVLVLAVPRPRPLSELWRARRPGHWRLRIDVQDFDSVKEVRVHGWRWLPGRFFPRGNHRLRMHYGRQAFQYLCSKIGRPDIIHAQGTLWAGVLGASLAEEAGIPLVITEHYSTHLRDMLSETESRAAASALEAADACLAVSYALAVAMQSLREGLPVEVVPNAVDCSFFRPADPPLEMPAAGGMGLRLICVGLLNENKRIDWLLRAVSLAFPAGRAELTVVGDGPERSRLEQLATSLGIGDRVNFEGACGRERVRELLQHSHVLVSTSRHETFGISLIEAMACGLPCLSTRSGGPQDILGPETGILIPVEPIEPLVDALRDMPESFARFEAWRIREEALMRFDYDVLANRLERIYSALVGGDVEAELDVDVDVEVPSNRESAA